MLTPFLKSMGKAHFHKHMHFTQLWFYYATDDCGSQEKQHLYIKRNFEPFPAEYKVNTGMPQGHPGNRTTLFSC